MLSRQKGDAKPGQCAQTKNEPGKREKMKILAASARHEFFPKMNANAAPPTKPPGNKITDSKAKYFRIFRDCSGDSFFFRNAR